MINRRCILHPNQNPAILAQPAYQNFNSIHIIRPRQKEGESFSYIVNVKIGLPNVVDPERNPRYSLASKRFCAMPQLVEL